MASLKKLNDDFDNGKLPKNTFSSELNNDFVISSDNSKSIDCPNGDFVDLDQKKIKEGAGSGGEESTILIKITTTTPANIDLMQASNHVDKTKNYVEPEAEVVNKKVEVLEAEIVIDANSKKSSKKDVSSAIEINRNGNFFILFFFFFFETFLYKIFYLSVSIMSNKNIIALSWERN